MNLCRDNPFILIFQLAHISGEEDECYFKLADAWRHLSNTKERNTNKGRADWLDWVIGRGRWKGRWVKQSEKLN